MEAHLNTTLKKRKKSTVTMLSHILTQDFQSNPKNQQHSLHLRKDTDKREYTKLIYRKNSVSFEV